MTKILLTGWHPDAVDFSKWPDLSEEKLRKATEKTMNCLRDEGFQPTNGWMTSESSALAEFRERISQTSYDIILFGAGVRKDPDHLELFESLLNCAISHSPKSKIAFNSGPDDTVAAAKRWV